MSRHGVVFSVLLSLLVAVVVLVAIAGERGGASGTVAQYALVPCAAFEENDAEDAESEAAPRSTPRPGTDRYGDPLPAGATARLGTVRFRHEIMTAVAWSPDGAMLASGSYGSPIRLWEVASGKEVRRFSGHDGGVWSMAWSMDGSRLASASSDSTLLVWAVAGPR
jgi:hypothetical protein